MNTQHQVKYALVVFWLLTQDDFATFVLPNTAFGIFGALSGSMLTGPHCRTVDVLLRLPLVVLFNWSNLLIFDLANQRLPESIKEDALNKPWRPAPSGLITSNGIRRAMLMCIPAVILFNHVAFQTGFEATALAVLTWLYNDLSGGDEHWMIRNGIIAVAFGLYNEGSLKVAGGSMAWFQGRDLALVTTTSMGLGWIVVVSGVILTTMHVQDLKDQEGDKARGRHSAPLILGDKTARWTIALPVIFWSFFCPWYCGLSLLPSGAGCFLLGGGVVIRCLTLSGRASDRRTWQLWALWTVSLYILPALSFWFVAHDADITADA
jgi:4-hydroxybenzoate polyprenyltransferase